VLREVFGLMKEDATGVGIEYGSLTKSKLWQIVLILKPFNVCIYIQKLLEGEVIINITMMKTSLGPSRLIYGYQ
jgi:hypothetical protein